MYNHIDPHPQDCKTARKDQIPQCFDKHYKYKGH